MTRSQEELRRARKPPEYLPAPVVRPGSRDGKTASVCIGWVVLHYRVYWYEGDWQTEQLGSSERMNETEARAMAALKNAETP